MKFSVSAFLLATFSLTIIQPAFATTGPGCLRVVNVQQDDVLNIRSQPTAASPVVGKIPAENHGVIVLKGKCEPLNRPWANRWCPITYYGEDQSAKGWVYARYIRDNDCP
ncbi:SH3 domain-containing protein [Paenochrobactrum sp. BZR 588]|uniref:SH3 domain-containing protein n=1 Tax=unclassified Paenochrobactrum TaxID=2639760 RepID=UPI0038545121